MSSSLGFRIVLEHWVREENKAKWNKVMQSRQRKIKTSVFLKSKIQQFLDTLEELRSGKGDREVIQKKLFKISFFMGKSQAPFQLCSSCEENFTRFELTSPFVRDRFMDIRCSNECCRRSEFRIHMPDHFFDHHRIINPNQANNA